MSTSSSARLCTILLLAAGLGSGCRRTDETQQARTSDTTSDPAGTAPGQARTEPGAEARRAQPQQRAPAPTGIALSSKYLECVGYVNASNWDALRDKCLAADLISHQIEQRDLQGADGLVQWMQDMKTAFPDWRLQPQMVLVNGRNIFGVLLSTGTHRGVLKSPMGDIAPTNKKIGQLFFHRIATTDELKASEEWAYLDPVGMLGQLGKLPGLPTREARTTGIEGAPIIVVAADSEKERQNLATVRTWNQLFGEHRNKELTALYTEDAVEADQADPSDWKGRREIEQGNQRYFDAFSNGRLETANLFAAGDYVVSMGSFTGTNDGKMGDMKKTGKDVSIQYAEVLRVENGKVAHVWRFRNGLALLEQLGMQPKLGKQPRTKQPATP